uniref:Alpha 1,3-galactosyltransferase 2 n=1 Tax=Cynoglossus semilaevis TaxID=244447 RepID=A0A3P8UPN3_CYNSE
MIISVLKPKAMCGQSCFNIFMCFFFFYFMMTNSRYEIYFSNERKRIETTNEEVRKLINIDVTLNYAARPDVRTKTPWDAPIIWEGMFDKHIYDQMHIHLKTNVAVTVFAVGGYLNVYLKTFLTSAEKYFMVGLPVTYFIFSDLPDQIPYIELGPQREIKIIKVERHSRWQDVSMMRMQTISTLIDSEIRHNFRYIFCLDVDQEFKGRFGSEALGESVAMFHAQFYRAPKSRYNYEKNPKSKAFMKTGDFYYHAAVFGGTWENVKNLTDTCFENIVADKVNNVEAVWHDESHLNKYFYLHKPTKLLSPEYCWNEKFPGKDIRIARLVWSPKYHTSLRT